MAKEALTIEQEAYLERMTKHLPVLRASMRISQQELAKKIGVTRQSMMNIETRRRQMQWATYLALVLVFQQRDDTKILMGSLEIFNDNILKHIE